MDTTAFMLVKFYHFINNKNHKACNWIIKKQIKDVSIVELQRLVKINEDFFSVT